MIHETCLSACQTSTSEMCWNSAMVSSLCACLGRFGWDCQCPRRYGFELGSSPCRGYGCATNKSMTGQRTQLSIVVLRWQLWWWVAVVGRRNGEGERKGYEATATAPTLALAQVKKSSGQLATRVEAGDHFAQTTCLCRGILIARSPRIFGVRLDSIWFKVRYLNVWV